MTIEDPNAEKFEAITRSYAAFMELNLAVIYPTGKPVVDTKHGTIRIDNFYSNIRSLEKRFWAEMGLSKSRSCPKMAE